MHKQDRQLSIAPTVRNALFPVLLAKTLLTGFNSGTDTEFRASDSPPRRRILGTDTEIQRKK
jgi:hypothetical protein